MRRTALLIGAGTYGLTGVANDVETMADVLGRRGFTVARCTGPSATRAGVLEHYERLITDIRDGDRAVVYFSGHGGLAVPGPGAALTRTPLQFLVPVDQDGAADFRGITAPELSVLLARLTNATPDVTVILDTCHAGHLSRDDDLSVKALPRPVYADVVAHLAQLREAGLDPSVRHVLGNQDAVRVVACGRDQSAYEYTTATGRRAGVLTEALAAALREAGDRPVTWAALTHRIRDLVDRADVPGQRPEVEGPALRPVLGPATVAATGDWHLPGVDTGPDPLWIEWGRLDRGRPCPLPAAGAVVDPGDRFYLRVRNDGAGLLHVAVVEADRQGRLSLLTSYDPSGVRLPPGAEHVVGRDDLDGRLTGFPLRPAPAALVVLAADRPHDHREQVGGPFRDLAPAGDDRVRVRRIRLTFHER